MAILPLRAVKRRRRYYLNSTGIVSTAVGVVQRYMRFSI